MRTFRFLRQFLWVGVFLFFATSAALAQPATVVATGLQVPIKIFLTPAGNLLVLEGGTGANTGRISIVSRSGTRRTLVDGLPSGINTEGERPTPIGPTGIEIVGDVLFVVIGSGDETVPGATPGSTLPNPSPASPLLSSVLRLRLGSVDATTGDFHLTAAQHAAIKGGSEVSLTNPQGETLKVSLVVDFPDFVGPIGSNPFGIAVLGSHIYVVDAALNRIQNVDPVTGNYETLTTFPQIANSFSPALGPPFIDVVPDSIRLSNGQFLVPFLTGFPFAPGGSSVARVDPSTGNWQTLIPGRTSAIDAISPAASPTKFLVLEFSTNMTAGAPGQLLFFNSATGSPTVLASPLITPTNMAFDPNSREVFITELGPGRVVRVSAADVIPAAPCTPDSTSLCLNGGRYRVRATFRTPQGATGNGIAVPLTSTSGYFWFFSPDNIEVTVKVLNGCSFNSRNWVFAAGMTNVGVTLTVTDTATGVTKTYENPVGTAFAPILDTAAFNCS
ncbi:MAG TPA: ScyD/ScyE family protein [Thermoanaerobaculia bacterium]